MLLLLTLDFRRLAALSALRGERSNQADERLSAHAKRRIG
jgi:hypothetical protein